MNQFKSTTTWGGLCGLSVRLTNSHPEEEPFRSDLVYLADNSCGDREVGGGPIVPSHGWSREDEKVAEVPAVDWIDSGFHGDWRGYQEEGATRFLWGSASSGAKIEAVRRADGLWSLSFKGCDTANRSESWYAVVFALAADIGGLEVENLDGHAALAAAIRNSLGWAEEQGKTEDAAKLRAFAVRLGLPLE